MIASQNGTASTGVRAPRTVPAQPEARILIVDDEPANVGVLTRLLESHGYQNIFSMLDPRQLLLSFLELEPDILLLDLHMPHLDGFAVLDLLRDWLPTDIYLPVVVLTADVTPAARLRALAAGATDFLTKPIDAIEVILRVEHHLQTRRFQRALQDRTSVLEGRLTAVLNSLDQIVWTADPEGRLTYVSDAVRTVIGRSGDSDEALRAFWPESLHPDDRDVAAGWLTRLRVNGRLDIEHRIVRPDGSVRWLETRCLLARDGAGRPLRIDGLSVDITERRRLADEVTQLAAQRERDRVTAELVATVSHELRTPISSLLGFSELLLEPDVSEEERASWTAVVHSEASRLAALVDDILDVSRIDAGRVKLAPQLVDARELANAVLLPFEARQDGGRFLRDFPAEPAMLTVDPSKMTRVLTNLVSNALKYSPNGGRVQLTIDRTDQHVSFRVSDDGLGLDPTDLALLFQRFQRVGTAEHQGVPGSGLGLYLARQLVELHGGRIWAESAGRGTGSTFTVELPAAVTTLPDRII